MKRKIKFFELIDNPIYFWMYLCVGLIFSIMSIIAPMISGDLVNAVIYQQDNMVSQFILLAIVYALLLAFSVLDQYSSNVFLIKQKQEMRNKSFRGFLNTSNMNREKISSFVSFTNNDIPIIAENYFNGTVDIIKCICIALCSSLALLNIHWGLAVIIVGCSVLIVAVPNLIRKKSATSRQKYSKAMEKYNTMLESFLGGIEVVRAYLYQKSVIEQINENNENIIKKEKRVRNYQVGIVGIAGCLQILKKFLILTVGVYLIYIQKIKIGELLVAVQLAEILASPIEVLAYLINGKNETIPLLERYVSIVEEKADCGNIRIENIDDIHINKVFYSVGNVDILKNLSAQFKDAKKYMLVGKSGSGKSTILRLLSKTDKMAYDGEILINGKELNEIELDSYRNQVGIVFQEPYLFWTSVKENILLGRQISTAEYEKLLKKMNLEYLLERFENEPLNEVMVSKLSSGEKQRISIARAMVGKPKLYLLDEVTSALDESNAYEIENMLLEENVMVIHACHKIIPQLKNKYDEIICLD